MTETPTPNLHTLRELAEAATPGPWTAEVLGSEGYAVKAAEVPHGRNMTRRPTVARCGYEDWQADRDAAQFIAAANPTAILALIERVEAAEAAVERVLALVDEVTATFDADLRNPHTERAAGLAAGAQALADDIRDALDADA